MPATVVAAEGVSTAPGVSFISVLQTFGALALILILFIGAAWISRRLNGSGGLTGLAGDSGPLRVVSSLPLGARERILLVEIEDTWLVIGVTPGQMRTLHTLPRGELPQASAPGQGQFAHWLRQFRDTKKNEKA